uniref:DUF6531 domain-containing protein n=1 Tax=Psychrobacter lutiphocae TaxID=540500 RepID=UPI001D17B045
MRLMTLTASILLSLAIANISNAANPLSAASNTITACNRIGTNGTPMCPAPTPTNQDNPDTNRAGGNPINLLTGNKFESATDIEATGGEYALRLNRYYNS